MIAPHASRRRPSATVIIASLTVAIAWAAALPAQAAPAPIDTTRRGTAPLVPPPAVSSRPTTADIAPPAVLTLDTAVALALAVGTPVQRARFATQVAQTAVARSYAAILPAVAALAGRTVTTGDPLVGSRAMAPWNTQFESMGYQLQTSLNLLGALAAYPGIRSAEYARQTSDLTLERTRQSVALDVSQAFLQTVLDSELVAIAAQNVTVSREQVVLLQELVRVGKRPPADQYQALAQENANQSLYLDAVSRQRTDEIALLERVHIDPQRTVAIAPPTLDTTLLSSQYLDTTRLADDALRRRPDLQSARAELDATRWGLRRASSENLPTVSAGFTLFSTGRIFDYAYQGGISQIAGVPQPALVTQIGNQTTHIFSIGIGYSLFDLFRSRLDYQEAQVAYGSAQVAAGDVRRAVTGDVARAISEYGVAVQRMGSTASGLTAAQAAFQLVSGRYNVGFSSIVELFTAQAALAQAQSLRAQAVVQLSLAKRALAYASGLTPTDRLP